MPQARTILVAASSTLLLLLALPANVVAQKCHGTKPKGGTFVNSAELYLQRAGRNTNPEDKRRLYDKALEVLREGFEKQPENPRNYELAGRVHVGLNDYVNADAAFSKAEQIWSCYAARIDTLRYNAWVRAFNRAVSYTNAGDTEKALAEYDRAWTIYKKLPQPMLQAGNLYAHTAMSAETDEARSSAQEKAIDAYRLALGALSEESERLSDAQRLEYGGAATFNLAQMLAFDDRFDEAAQAYASFLELDPGNTSAKSNAAVVNVQAARQARDAAELLEEGPEKEALLAKADSLTALATRFYAELLATEDLEASEYHNIGLGLSQAGARDDALMAFRKALELEPYRMNSLDQLARTLFAAQEWERLSEVGKTLVERYPLSLDNLALLINAYREREMGDSALAILQLREDLQAELLELELEGEEGVYKLSGYLQNLKSEPGTELTLQFDFYDSHGAILASETLSLSAPEKEGRIQFSVTTESSAAISGFSYRLADPGTAQTGS